MTKGDRRVYEFGPFRLDTAEAVLLRDGRPVPLTLKAYETLLVLIRDNGHIVPKEDLLKLVWPDTFVEEGNLAHNIWTLRKALGESDAEKYIETVPRRGYRFAASRPRSPARDQTSVPSADAAAGRPAAAIPRWRGWALVGVLAIAVVAVVLGTEARCGQHSRRGPGARGDQIAGCPAVQARWCGCG